jgi:hypothetical protein
MKKPALAWVWMALSGAGPVRSSLAPPSASSRSLSTDEPLEGERLLAADRFQQWRDWLKPKSDHFPVASF